MKRLSSGTLTYICLALLLVLALVFFLVNRNLTVEPSDDPLSRGIVERWGAALPAGFEKQAVDHIGEDGGFLFARLAYEKDIGSALAKWEASAEDTQARFDAVIEEMLSSGGATAQEAALIAEQRPVLGQGWVWFSMADEENPDAEILLAYDKAARVMYVVERG